MTLREEAEQCTKFVFCNTYGCPYSNGWECPDFPCEDAKMDIDTVVADWIVEAASLTEPDV
jgi:hypothetical protein